MMPLLDRRIEAKELEVLAAQYQRQVARGHPSTPTIFAYAKGMCRSKLADVQIGVRLLDELLQQEHNSQLAPKIVFWQAYGNARLRNYDRALALIDSLLLQDDSEERSQDLKAEIEGRMKKDALLGAAVIGTGAAVLAGIVGGLYLLRK
ncbi:unnamed protein product, partial [Mesorhabditis spiculigera]